MEKFLRSNNFARALAIFLAVILWLFVMGEDLTQTTRTRKDMQDVPLKFKNLEPGLVIVEMPGSVNVTLEGLAEAFERLTVREVEAYVDLAERGPGSHRLPVRVEPPRGLSLVAYAPEQVTVTAEPVSNAFYPVYVEFAGTPAPGWVRQSYSIDPNQVSVEAPQSLLEQVNRVILRIDQSGMRDQYEGEIAPLVLDAQGGILDGINLDPARVAVSVKLVRQDGGEP